jgi:hypothetical protein
VFTVKMWRTSLSDRTPLKPLDELVHPDTGPASVCLSDRQRFDIGIELAPLSSPIVADLSGNFAALRRLGPAHAPARLSELRFLR